MSVFTKIKALQTGFSEREARLAKYIVANPEHIRDFSSQELAKHVGVSQSSVVKFSQKLGYKGYPAFKIAIIEAFSQNTREELISADIARTDSHSQFADKLLASKIKVLQETRELNDVVSLEQAVGHIRAARRVLVAGNGDAALVAKDFSHKLQRLGINAIAEFDSHVQIGIAANLDEQDVVLAISENGNTRETVSIVNEATANGCTVISITKFGRNPIAINANVRLYSVTDESSVRFTSIMSRTGQQLVIDLLFIALTQGLDDGHRQLEKANQVIERFRSS